MTDEFQKARALVMRDQSRLIEAAVHGQEAIRALSDGNMPKAITRIALMVRAVDAAHRVDQARTERAAS